MSNRLWLDEKRLFKKKKKELKPSDYFPFRSNTFFAIIVYLMIIYTFIPNSYIESSSFLLELSSIFDDILPAIENTANISYHYGLYYKMKLSLVVGIFIGLIMFFPTLYLLSKIYLSSLGIINAKD